jgi:cytochrome c-type biogenesis protein CcmH
MSSFTPFVLAAALLCALTVFWLTRPWWEARLRARLGQSLSTDAPNVPTTPAHDALNAAIYREQLADLSRDRDNGLLAQADYQSAHDELNRRLLDDVVSARTHSASAAGSQSTAAPALTGFSAWAAKRKRAPTWFALILLLPLSAASIYLQVGNPAGVLDTTAQARRSMDEMESAVASLAKKLAEKPENPEGWAMLARSYGMLGRWDEAIAAFERIGPTLDNNAHLLAAFAETRFRAADNQFTPTVRELIAKALLVEPDNMHARLLAGSEAFQSSRWADAITHWGVLQRQLEPGSEDAREIGEGIARARAELGDAAPATTATGKTAPGDSAQVSAGKTAITRNGTLAKEALTGRVNLSAALKADAPADATVFIIARAVGTPEQPAPRMPLAGLRITVADLPYRFTLDDSRAMNPEMTISRFKKVRIEARVSRSGNATASSGDLIGQSEALAPGSRDIEVQISQKAH